jgi:uncharacterized membrane-anchored protein
MNTNTANNPLELWSKVPEITLYFWVIKMFSTTVGETFADFLNADLGFGLTGTSVVMGIVLLIALAVQIASKKYSPPKYWFAVVLVSVVGTLITDNLVDNFGVSLVTLSIVFTVALAASFIGWYASEKTLSIHSITSVRRELFYWLTILVTFTLGTAVGDLAAESLQLGYLNSALAFGGIIALVAFAYYVLKANAVLTFWIAYILTRPLGASFGDLLSQPVENSGLGLGTMGTSALFLAVIFILVSYLTITRKDAIRIDG